MNGAPVWAICTRADKFTPCHCEQQSHNSKKTPSMRIKLIIIKRAVISHWGSELSSVIGVPIVLNCYIGREWHWSTRLFHCHRQCTIFPELFMPMKNFVTHYPISMLHQSLLEYKAMNEKLSNCACLVQPNTCNLMEKWWTFVFIL